VHVAPALGGVAEIAGANGAKRKRAKRSTFNFIDHNNKFLKTELTGIARNKPYISSPIYWRFHGGITSSSSLVN
jgi:hypothetical protein